MADIDVLKKKFKEFCEIPFPDDSDDDMLSELHARLAEYDTYIAGIICTLIGGGKVDERSLLPNNELRKEITEAISKVEPNKINDAYAYLEYLDMLDNLLKMAREVISNR